MTTKDRILTEMLAHPLILERYKFDNTDHISVVGPSTKNTMVELIRAMIKEVEIHKKSEDEVVNILLRTLND